MTHTSTSTIQEFLAGIYPFEQLSSVALAKLATQCQLLRYRIGQAIVVREKMPSHVVILYERQARLLGYDPRAETPVTLKLLQPGEILGWIGLLRGVPCETAIASGETICLVLSAEDFLAFLEQEPLLANAFRSQCTLVEVFDLLGAELARQANSNVNLKELALQAQSKAVICNLLPGTVPLNQLDPERLWFVSGGGTVVDFPIASCLNLENASTYINVTGSAPARLVGFPKLSELLSTSITDILKNQEEEATFVDADSTQKEDITRLSLSNRRALDENKMNRLEVGEVFIGSVRGIKPYGAFIDIGGVSGLLHISEISYHHVDTPHNVFKVNEKVKVLIIHLDAEWGHISLSTKQLEPEPGDMLKNPQVVYDNAEEMAAKYRERMRNQQEDSSTKDDSESLGFTDALFIAEVLQETQDSNGDPQVIYPLLQANLDKLDDNLAQQLGTWATNTLPELAPSQAQITAANIANFSKLISQFSLGNKDCNIEIAITGYELVAQVFTRETFPTDWARTQNNLGKVYCNRIRGERASNLEEAIACFQNALQVYTRSVFPVDWATTQNNLGEAYSNRIRGDRAQNWEQAIVCFQAALEVYTDEAFPSEWAKIQNNLGTAYSDRIWGEREENLEQAIAAYQAALTIYTRETFPYEWASTCKNLGNAYTEKIHDDRLSNLDGLANIEYAILYYQDALEVYTQETFPREWASIRDSFVNAHYILESYQREIKFSSFPQPITRNEVISRIEFVRKNILDLEVDALVRPTNTSLSFGGNMSTEMLARIEPECYEKWQNQPKPSIGEVLVTDASSLSARYIFHTPIDHNVDATVTTICQAITAALTKAESLGDVRTIAFPSVGTGVRGLNSADLAPKILRIVTTHLEHGSQLEKVIFAFRNEFAYRTYVGAYQMLLLEAAVAYEVFMAISPEAALVGEEIAASIDLRQVGTTDVEAYVLQVPRSEAAEAELNILLTAPGFQFNGDYTASLPLDPNTGHITQTACFRLTALRPGTAKIIAELYRGDSFETNLEAKVQVAGFDEAGLLGKGITTQPRPVPQPDFILRVQTAWNETNSACRFHYQLRSFRLPSLFPGETNYHSESFSNSGIEQMRGLLGTTLENISDALPEDGRSHLTSLGQYLFQHLLPPELQTDFRTLIPRDRTFTLLILADQDASLPWELLHDGQQFLSDRFIIGRWFWELNDTRSHEFPVGAINVAHYADVEQPERWTALLEPPGSPPPLPLPEGVLGNLDSTEAMRGLHLIRYSQSSDTANRRNAPVTLDDTNNAQDIERQMRPAKLNLRRNRPLVSLGYVRRARPELTTLEQTWASAFIRAGCSAFTGSLWAVDPAVEAAFISGFYNRLWTGDSLGEAFHASRQLARAVVPDSLDWLAYVLFGDPMARPYRPVEGKGYAVVEPIGREIDEPLSPGVPVRFRLSLRRTPPVWHEERVIEVAENLTFENLQAHVKTFGLQVTPDSPIAMSLAPTGNYLGWFTLVAPPEMAGNSALVQVFLMDGMLPIHSLMFSLNIENEEGSSA